MIGDMKNTSNIPKIVSVVSIILGSIDLVRGFMHTILLNFAASNIAGLDLSTAQASDLLQLMGAFGISNYITGIALILVGWKARDLAWIMLGVVPATYLIGGLAIRFYSTGSTETQAAWGGISMMAVYLAVSTITFLYGLLKKKS